MKYIVKYTTAYKKAYKCCLRQKRDMELLNQVVGMLADGKKLPARYRDHSLSAYVGFPRVLNGIFAAKEAFSERAAYK